jgi:hypothetical protein
MGNVEVRGGFEGNLSAIGTALGVNDGLAD